MQQHFFQYFAREFHCNFVEDVTIVFIGETDPKNLNRWEHYWRHTLNTIRLPDLNIEND